MPEYPEFPECPHNPARIPPDPEKFRSITFPKPVFQNFVIFLGHNDLEAPKNKRNETFKGPFSHLNMAVSS